MTKEVIKITIARNSFLNSTRRYDKKTIAEIKFEVIKILSFLLEESRKYSKQEIKRSFEVIRD